MKRAIEIFKVLSDEQRLRILMLLHKRELCVCQLMGILGVSQPLVSRNLSMLSRAGFLDERREGKLRFYRLKKEMKGEIKGIVNLLHRILKDDITLKDDLSTLRECTEFQKMTGRCDMKTFMEFMEKKKSGK
jgi:ArsR family transcriptional regulator